MNRIVCMADLVALGDFVCFGANWAGAALISHYHRLSGRMPLAIVDNYRDGCVGSAPIVRPETVFTNRLPAATPVVLVARREDELVRQLAGFGFANLYGAIDYAELLAGAVTVRLTEAGRAATREGTLPAADLVADRIDSPDMATPLESDRRALWALDGIIRALFAGQAAWGEAANRLAREDGIIMLRPTAPHLPARPPALTPAVTDALTAEILDRGFGALPIQVGTSRPAPERSFAEGMVIAALPKSGTVLLGATLSRLSAAQTLWLPDIPDYPASARAVCRIGRRAATPCIGHLPPERRTLDVLREAGVARVHVHGRNPVAAAWSHLLWNKSGAGMSELQRLDHGLAGMPKTETVLTDADFDFLVYLSQVKLEWMKDWRRIDPGPDLVVTFGTYRDLVDRRENYLHALLGREPGTLAADVTPPRYGVNNFRGGNDHEWRSRVPAAYRPQLDRICAAFEEL